MKTYPALFYDIKGPCGVLYLFEQFNRIGVL